MPTPHISAPHDAFAHTVLMPGDPLRAKYVAHKFLTDVREVTAVRNMLGFTGLYNEKAVSVMGSGMGMASMGIYSYELYKFYGVENILRIGSAGSYNASLHLADVVLADKSYSDSTYALMQNGCTDKIMLPDPGLNKIIQETATRLNIPCHLANVYSSDVFYTDTPAETWQQAAMRTKTDCVEMESFALFHNANVLRKRAATLLTISDNFHTDRHLSAEQRQLAFNDMILLALESTTKL